ncbi:DUF4251 domain-containing protein [Flavobacteriaceae bacterium]|nr:DUF4251 domain-containing protein [Flavobacteriaceae bacterium]
MRKLILICTVILIATSSAFAQSKKEEKAEKKKQKEEKKEEYYEAFKKLIDSKDYDFEAVTMFPQDGSSIDITGESNYVKIRHDQADIYMPYMGSSQTLNSFTQRENGIIFKGEMQDYKVEINEKNGRIKISFSGKAQGESLDFVINFYKNLSASLMVNSSARDGISYNGSLLLPEDQRVE